ncbi:MAG TPA: ABC transporter ATP-binding protein [Pyrinomonadaceae bacterium]
MRLRSRIRGRERWEVKALRGRPGTAQDLERLLSQRQGVLHVKANPTSAGVLVTYSTDTPDFDVEALIREGFKQLPPPVASRPSGAKSGSAISGILKSFLPRDQALTPPVLSTVGHSVHLLQGLSFVSIVNTARGSGPGFLRSLGIVSTGAQLLVMTGWSLLLTGVDLYLQYHRKEAWRRLGQATQHDLRDQLITRIEKQDVEFFDRYGTGPLIDLVTKDTAQVGEFVERSGDVIIEKALTIAVAGFFIITSAPSLGLIIFLPLPIIFLSSRFFGGKITERYARRGETTKQFNQMLENNLAGIADVKSFTAEWEEARRLSECDAALAQHTLGAERAASLQTNFISGLFSTTFVLTAGYAGFITAGGGISLSNFLRLVYWFPQLLRSLTGIEQVTGLYHRADDSAGRLARVLESYPQIQSGPVRLSAEEVRGEVIFEDVSFGYDPSVKVLENVSFHLRPGETVGIVGPTGSGKSTLLRLLLRFFDVDSGRISLDGNDIRDLDLHNLRSAVSMVSQDVYLFQGTIRENVIFGQRRATEEQILEAMRDAGALDLITSVPGGLDAEVGERGRRLSGGQRQRVAIARALLKLTSGASILALDEATSHLDNETESAFKRSLRKAATGKNVIIIAHRLSTIRSVDRILVLESGRITEAGTHDELLAHEGLYASLWRLQNEDPFGDQLEIRLKR